MANIVIRSCRSDEFDVVLGIWKSAGSMTSYTDSVAILKRLIQLENTALFVAEDNKQLVGSVIAAFDGWRGNIYRLAVLPECRKRGIARRLVREAEKFLISRGAERIGGLVAKDNPLAVSFWDALADDNFERDETFVRYAKNV